MSEYQFIKAERDGEVAIFTLNRPEVLNAWHAAMRAELVDALRAADADETVRAIVLTGAGDRAFCAGQDLSETEGFTGGEDAHRWLDGWRVFYDTIRGLTKPYVAALNGTAAGSAFQTAIMADVVVGHPGVKMGQPEINSGIPSTLGPWLMIDRIGLGRTVELTLTGRMMDAEEAHRLGLVHRLVAPEDVRAEALATARLLASKPPQAMRANKARFRELTEPGFREALEAGHAMQEKAFASGEPQAAMRAFFERRAAAKQS